MAVDVVKVNMEAGKILEICRDIELVNAELYRYFAEIFKGHAEMAALWHKTADEEANHARQFVLAIKMRRDVMVDSLAIDGGKAQETLKIVNAYYASVQKTPPTMLDALAAAIKIEKGLASFHMTTAVNFTEARHKKLFTAMMEADRDHLDALQKFHRDLSGTQGACAPSP